MQVLKLPAGRGWRWLAEGFAIYRRKPAPLSFLVLGYWLTMAVISAIPYIGQMIGFILIPAFSVSLMNVCWLIDADEQLPPQTLFSGFHRNLQTLLMLGVVYVVASLSILGLTALVDDGLLFNMLVLGNAPNPQAMDGVSLFIAAQMAAILLVPVMMAFWFAPVLAAWHDMSAGKSLFFSLMACLRNWRPFLVYSLAIALAGILVPQLIAGLLAGAGDSSALSTLITVMISLILLPTLYASFYVSYRDVFRHLEDQA